MLRNQQKVRELKINGDSLRQERNKTSDEIGLLYREKKIEEAKVKYQDILARLNREEGLLNEAKSILPSGIEDDKELKDNAVKIKTRIKELQDNLDISRKLYVEANDNLLESSINLAKVKPLASIAIIAISDSLSLPITTAPYFVSSLKITSICEAFKLNR